MMALSRSILVVLVAAVLLLVICPAAVAVPPAAGAQTGHPVSAAAPVASKEQSSPLCEVAGPVVGGLIPAIGQLVGANPSICEAAGKAAGGLANEAVSAVGNSVLEGVTTWLIGAATQITTFVASEMRQTTTPQLQSAWYEAQFRPMADLGAALGLLVAMIALASAAIRRSPEALAATIAGIVRAGIGTGLVIPLTVIGLGIADEISSAVLTASPHTFWATIAHAWGTKGFGGFGSSALAAVIALIEVFAGVFVWLELIVRNAAIYIAPLFFAATLAAAIWPVLSTWPGRLARLLLLFVILKPVALIVLSLAGSAAAAGLSFNGGVSGSVGTILAAIVIFALAAFAPWALMYLLAADAETAYMAAGMRAATGAAVADKDGRSVRSGGGLRNLAGQNGGAAGGRSQGSGGSPRGGGTEDGGGGGSVGPSGDGGPAAGGDAAGAGGGAGAGDGSLAVGGETIGAGSVGAAAGAGVLSAQSSGQSSQAQRPAAQTPGSQDPPSPSAQDSSARPPIQQGQPLQGSTGGEAERAAPRAPARAPADGPNQDSDGAGGQEHPGGSSGAPRPRRPSPGGAPRQPAQATTGPSPRGRPRRSPVLAGGGPSRPSSPQRHGDRGE
jgi:hypothetical protein